MQFTCLNISVCVTGFIQCFLHYKNDMYWPRYVCPERREEGFDVVLFLDRRFRLRVVTTMSCHYCHHKNIIFPRWPTSSLYKTAAIVIFHCRHLCRPDVITVLGSDRRRDVFTALPPSSSSASCMRGLFFLTRSPNAHQIWFSQRSH